MKAFVRRALDHLARAIRFVVGTLVVVMLVALSLQVVMRYVFGQALSWSEELALACFSWSTLLAMAGGVRDGIHVRMDLLADRLPARGRVALERLVALAIGGAGVFIAWAGVRYVDDSSGTTSAAIGFPVAYLYACAPVCGALIAVFALEHLLLGPPKPAGKPASASASTSAAG
ncbi:TRAP transporter small permease [Pseudorhodoferax sp.]|uniref:TRAP transporter small permease n=1 Tax=Pseudorhodoferax sp. TaxID=1993553 RepID=UPI002DD6879E|nr:TRAP transporter small permease [Pseudorhodoferax sp.]